MPTYTCEKCAKVFQQKSGYTAHMNRKKSCDASTKLPDVIASAVREAVKEVSSTIPKSFSNASMYASPITGAASVLDKPKEVSFGMGKETTDLELQKFFEQLHNMLWSKAGLNPQAALEHLIFFFAYRLIELQADALGLPQECRWSYLANLPDEDTLYETMKKGVSAFQKNKITKQFFKKPEIQKAETVMEIVKHINTISIKTLQETDTLGNIFEYMLSRGMSTMADEGQYFTNRKICALAFRLAHSIHPALRREDGSLCTFADWFCGTGGFAAEYVKGVKSVLSDIDWKKESGSIMCQDMNQSSVTTTLLNLLILTGTPFSSDTIRSGNSFVDPITQGSVAPFKNKVIDFTFMNPPYGGDKTKGKEFKFAYCKETKDETGSKVKKYFVNQEIQSIGIEDDDKVSAGVQLGMATMSSTGVAAIVLPQGFFFGASKKCIELRKKITEEYKIHYVVDIASGAFFNTGTKTSMLVFEKGKTTEKVQFMDMEQKVLVEATLEELRGKHYSLNFKQYLAQSAVEVEGFEMVKLGELVSITTGKNKTPDDKKGTMYPYYGTSGITGYTDHYLEDGEYILTARNGTIGNTFLIKGKTYPSDHMFTLRANEKCILKYIYYWMITNKKVMENLANTTTIPGITRTSLVEIQIPLPSLERQQQIVEAIDGWAELAQHEEKALKLLEKQVMFQVKEMGRGQPRVKLGEIATFTFGYGIKSEDFGEVGLPIIKTKNFKDENVSIISSNPRSNKKYDDKYLIKKGDLLMVVDGACGESAIWREDENGWLNQHVAKLSIDNETTRMYIAFVMKGNLFKEYIQSNIVITTIPHMQRDVAKNFEIPLPPLKEQQTLQSDFDEIKHKHAKIAIYKAKAQEAIQRLIPTTA